MAFYVKRFSRFTRNYVSSYSIRDGLNVSRGSDWFEIVIHTKEHSWPRLVSDVHIHSLHMCNTPTDWQRGPCTFGVQCPEGGPCDFVFEKVLPHFTSRVHDCFFGIGIHTGKHEANYRGEPHHTFHFQCNVHNQLKYPWNLKKHSCPRLRSKIRIPILW